MVALSSPCCSCERLVLLLLILLLVEGDDGGKEEGVGIAVAVADGVEGDVAALVRLVTEDEEEGDERLGVAK
jgi:hypothetical protein